MKFTTPRTITAIAIAGLTLAIASPALAVSATSSGPASTVSSVKATCLAEIGHQLGTLADQVVVLEDARSTTADHLATLQGIISNNESGLRSAQTRLSETDNPTLIREICSATASDFMVDEVVVPQIAITVAADRIMAAEWRVIDPTLGYARSVAEAEAKGADMSETVRLHDLATDEFMAAFDAIRGVSDSVLTVTVVTYAAGPGADVIAAAEDTLADVHDQMQTAWSNYKAATQAFADALAAI